MKPDSRTGEETVASGAVCKEREDPATGGYTPVPEDCRENPRRSRRPAQQVSSPVRVAWVSPWPPQRSGIADYSAELVPALAAHAQVELFVDDRLAAELAKPPGGESQRPAPPVPVHPLSQLPRRMKAGEHDVALYHLGNDRRFHGAILPLLAEVPGVVVLHEHVLHHLVLGATAGRGDSAAYLEELRYAYGATGVALGRRAVETGVPVDPWAYPLFERAVDRALGLIVHSEATRRRVLASRPEARVEVVPHHLSLAELPRELDPASARHALGVPEGAFTVASFGFMTSEKRLGVALRAFARLRATRPEAVFLVAGEIAPGLDLSRELAAGDGVRLLGRVELPQFLAAMQACDVAVNLRHPTGGETSGTVIRLLGLGKPVLVSRQGSFAELPDGCCAKIEVDDAEEDHLAAVLERLAADPDLRQAMGDNARRHLAAHHTLEGSAAAYAGVLSRAVEEDWRPYRAVPPLAPFPRHDLLSALLAELAADVADLGLADAEGDALAAIAEQVVDLGLDRVASP